MTLDKALAKARAHATILHETYYVLGPCPIDGYWIASQRMRSELWRDRTPVATVTRCHFGECGERHCTGCGKAMVSEN